jgi:exosortase/archaeosortase family protein
VQVAVSLTAVVLAFHYSLRSLLQSLSVDTPLAYVGLVPVIALALAYVYSRPKRKEPAIHDRQLDYIVGLPLIAIALLINLVLPSRLSTMFWVWRVDLLSLPLFVAGVICVVFGLRALWRQRVPVAFLFLAWPVPYTAILLHAMNSFTNVTLHGVKMALKVFPVAESLPGSDGSVFQIVHHGTTFPLSVVSACSGVNGIVGFLLVGLAFAAVVTGPRLRKTLWLIGGILLLWAINLGRLVFIFWVGRTWGEHVAINIFHPFIGLVTFNLGVVLMILALKPIGLRIGFDRALGSSGSGNSSGGPSAGVPGGPVAVPRIFSAVAVVAVVGMVLAVNNAGLHNYDLVANAAGEPKLASYSANPAAPTGWRPDLVTQYDWAKPLFGASSTWLRYSYIPTLTGGGDLHSSLPVVADVINTNDLQSFSAYGVEACYRFHGYSLSNMAQVRLGGGITGQTLTYTTSNQGNWTIVWWIWPTKFGDSTHYERVILYILDTASGTVEAPGIQTGIRDLRGKLGGTTPRQQHLAAVRSFLVGFGREVVKGQTAIPFGSKFTPGRTNVIEPPRSPLLNPKPKPQTTTP